MVSIKEEVVIGGRKLPVPDEPPGKNVSMWYDAAPNKYRSHIVLYVVHVCIITPIRLTSLEYPQGGVKVLYNLCEELMLAEGQYHI